MIEVYAITAVLGEVANMSWLGETTINVTGAQADRDPNAPATAVMDIEVQSSVYLEPSHGPVTVISTENHSSRPISSCETSGQ